nr:MAG TPA: hypothetical protein [Caudoviricetes sp.]
MLTVQKTINVSGVSSVDVEGKATPFVYFNAQIQADGKRSVNYAIQNEELYKNNKETFKADRADFADAVESLSV